MFLGLWRPVLCNLQNIGALDESAPFDFRHVELELRYNFLYCLSKNCRKVNFPVCLGFSMKQPSLEVELKQDYTTIEIRSENRHCFSLARDIQRTVQEVGAY